MCKLLSLMAAALLFTVAALAGGQEPAKQPLQDKQRVLDLAVGEGFRQGLAGIHRQKRQFDPNSFPRHA